MLQIIEAIEKRLLLKFQYKTNTFRNADVYALGLGIKGELMIRAFEDGIFKLFKVTEMNNITVTSTKCYGHKSGYNTSTDKAFIKVLKKVK